MRLFTGLLHCHIAGLWSISTVTPVRRTSLTHCFDTNEFHYTKML